MQFRPWDFMVKDTPSRDWAEGMGILIPVAFFCGGVAGGLYMISLYFNNLWGMLIGWAFALGMGLFDMAHLHRKRIVWRIALRPMSSWISRGFLLVVLFICTAAVQMALTRWAPGTAPEFIFKVAAGITALGVATYSGFVLSYIDCVKIWNSAIMPLLFVVAGFAGGAAISLVTSAANGATQFEVFKILTISILLVYAFVTGLHLWISTYNGSTARNSVKLILKGNLAGIFWLAVVVIGIGAPLITVILTGPGALAALIVNAICVLAGTLALRYVILRAGMYRPLLDFA